MNPQDLDAILQVKLPNAGLQCWQGAAIAMDAKFKPLRLVPYPRQRFTHDLDIGVFAQNAVIRQNERALCVSRRATLRAREEERWIGAIHDGRDLGGGDPLIDQPAPERLTGD